jgi:hypothetical protein
MPTNEEWGRLTTSPAKRIAYSEEPYFRECWADWAHVLGGRNIRFLPELAMMVFKPEAVVGRRMGLTVELILREGFKPIAAATLRLSRLSMREIWRYDWLTFPVDRLALATLMHSSTDTLMLLFRDTPLQRIPGSVRLSELKGPAEMNKRHRDHLRTRLAPPNSIINFFHVADEPVDIIRELGILFDREERRRLLRDATSEDYQSAGADVVRSIRLLEDTFDAHDLDFARSLERVLSSQRIMDQDVQRLIGFGHEGSRMSWDELTALLDPADPHVDTWDFVSIASCLLPEERMRGY